MTGAGGRQGDRLPATAVSLRFPSEPKWSPAFAGSTTLRGTEEPLMLGDIFSAEELQSLKNVMIRVELRGISFAGCHGIADKSEAAISALVTTVMGNIPPRYYATLEEWEADVERDAYHRFGKEVKIATDPLNVDALVNIFPGREDEEPEDYLARLFATLNSFAEESAPKDEI